MLLAKLEEAELGERAALGEASRAREDNEGLKVSHRVGIAMMGFLQEKRGKCGLIAILSRKVDSNSQIISTLDSKYPSRCPNKHIPPP